MRRHIVIVDNGQNGRGTIIFENIAESLPDGGLRYFFGRNAKLHFRFTYLCKPHDFVSHEVAVKIANAISRREGAGQAGEYRWRVTWTTADILCNQN
jgi:hypothetical protein